MNNIQEILNDRIKHSEIDMYYSFNAIKDILDNRTIINNFNQFKDLVDYIEEQTKKIKNSYRERVTSQPRGNAYFKCLRIKSDSLRGVQPFESILSNVRYIDKNQNIIHL